MTNYFNWAKKIYADKFNRYLIVALLIIGMLLIFIGGKNSEQIPSDNLEVHFFFHPQCPYCNAQKAFNEQLMEKFPQVRFVYHDVTKPEESALIIEFANKAKVPLSNLRVPFTVFGDNHFIGFDTAETTGLQIESALEAYALGQIQVEEIKEAELEKTITIPFFGQINVLEYSLPALAVVLGLVDGFNPCAMWVLVYLISLIIGLNDKKKIWLIVGSFVFASGVLYFLFMTAWLNVFLLIGYIRPLTIIIGLGAIYVGVTNLRDYIKTKGALICKVDDVNSREKTMSRIQKIVQSPLTIATIFGIIGLAFVVNSIEFVCSSALPAIFTHVLTISNLSTLGYYGYILLYDLFFMLDDLIIFALAVFAVNTTLSTKYAKYCKLIGGVVLLILGLMLTFAPHLLR